MQHPGDRDAEARRDDGELEHLLARERDAGQKDARRRVGDPYQSAEQDGKDRRADDPDRFTAEDGEDDAQGESRDDSGEGRLARAERRRDRRHGADYRTFRYISPISLN